MRNVRGGAATADVESTSRRAARRMERPTLWQVRCARTREDPLRGLARRPGPPRTPVARAALPRTRAGEALGGAGPFFRAAGAPRAWSRQAAPVLPRDPGGGFPGLPGGVRRGLPGSLAPVPCADTVRLGSRPPPRLVRAAWLGGAGLGGLPFLRLAAAHALGLGRGRPAEHGAARISRQEPRRR